MVLPSHNTSVAPFNVLPIEPQILYLEMGRNIYSGLTTSQTKFSGFNLESPSLSPRHLFAGLATAHMPAHVLEGNLAHSLVFTSFPLILSSLCGNKDFNIPLLLYITLYFFLIVIPPVDWKCLQGSEVNNDCARPSG